MIYCSYTVGMTMELYVTVIIPNKESFFGVYHSINKWTIYRGNWVIFFTLSS